MKGPRALQRRYRGAYGAAPFAAPAEGQVPGEAPGLKWTKENKHRQTYESDIGAKPKQITMLCHSTQTQKDGSGGAPLRRSAKVSGSPYGQNGSVAG